MSIKTLVEKKAGLILWSAIFLYFLVFSLISFWKYYNFLYNGLDLAIINQALFNSSLGKFFVSSIHPPSYLGDHFEPILFLLLPIYLLFKNPLTLLVLQTAILALGAIPVYKISQIVFKKNGLAVLLALAYLFNPFIQNINLFEFHFLPFAVFFLLFAFYFYHQKRFLPYLIFILLGLLVREDVSLVIFAFGILALFDRRKIKWVLTPLILAASYFISANLLINHFSTTGSYKFLYYYSWLGNSWLEIFKDLLLHPWVILKRIITLGNIEMVLGLLLPLAFLPVLAPKYLLLSVLVYLQILLGAIGPSGTLLQMHYSTLFLPALFFSIIFALEKIINKIPTQNKILNWLQKEKILVLIIFGVAFIYGNLTLGPMAGTAYKIYTQGLILPATRLKNQLLKLIPPQVSVAATYEFSTKLSSRPRIYSLNYAFLAKTQFAEKDYFLPADTEYLAIDFSDLIYYQFQYQNSPLFKNHYSLGDDNLRKIIGKDNFGILEIADNFAILKKGLKSDKIFYQFFEQLPKIQKPKNINLENKLKFFGYNSTDGYFQLFFAAQEQLATNYQLELSLKDKNNKIIFKNFYPLAYGLYPTSEWSPGQFIGINYWFKPELIYPSSCLSLESKSNNFLTKILYYLKANSTKSTRCGIKKISAGTYGLGLKVVEIKGGLELDWDRSIISVFDKIIPLGQKIDLGEIKLNDKR